MPFNVFRMYTDGVASANPSFRGWWSDAQQPVNCLIYIWAHNDGGGTPLTISNSHASDPNLGWVELHGAAPNNSGTRTAFWYRRRTAAAVPEPTITGAVDEWSGFAELLTGIDASTAIDASAVTEQTSNTNTPTAPSVVTTTDFCVIRHLCGCDGISVAPTTRERIGSFMIVSGANDNPASTGGTAGHVCVHRVQEAAGATGTFRFGLGGSDGGRQMTIAFRLAAGAPVPGYCKPVPVAAPEAVFPFPQQSQWSAITSIHTIMATIDGVTVRTPGSVTTGSSGGIGSEAQTDDGYVGGWNNLQAAQPASPAGLAGYYGAFATISAGPVDWQNNLYVALKRSQSQNQRAIDTPLDLFLDASGNWALLRTASRSTYNNMSLHVARLPDLTPVASFGSIDWAAITRAGFAKYAGTNTEASTRPQSMDFKYVLALPAQTPLLSMHGDFVLEDIELALKAFGLGSVTARIQGGVQLLTKFGVQVGDGGIGRVSYRGEGASIAFPFKNDGYDVGPLDNVFRLDLGPADDVDISALSIVSQDEPVDFHIANASDPAALTGSAAVLIGQALDLVNGQPLNGTTVIASPQALCYAATLTDCVFKTTASTEAAARWTLNGGGFVGGTIDLAGVSCGHHIVLGPSVTDFDLRGAALAGPAAVSQVLVERAAGTVTITLAELQTPPTYTSAGALVEFDQPVPTVQALVTWTEPNSRVLIANVTKATLFLNDQSGITSWSMNYVEGTSFEAGDTVIVRVRKPGFVPQDFSTVIGEGWQLPVSQPADPLWGNSPVANITFDVVNKKLRATGARAQFLAQEVGDYFRVAEATSDGILLAQMVKTSGRASLAPGVEVALTVELLDNWQLSWAAGGVPDALVTGGNVVGGIAGKIVESVAGGPQVTILLSAAAAEVSSGGSVPSAADNAAAVWAAAQGVQVLSDAAAARAQAALAVASVWAK